MKTVLLTGASGFIGSRLIDIINDKYSDSLNLVLLTSSAKDGYKYIIHNDYNFDKNDFYRSGIDTIDAVIHLGGFVPKNAQESRDFAKHFSTINNTYYLLKHLPNIPKTFIYCSTISVYGDFSDGIYNPDESMVLTENSPIEIGNSYALTRFCCEKIVNDWARDNGVISQTLRLSHVYGIGSRKKVMMKLIEKAVKGEDIDLWAAPTMRRNTLYLDDCCNMIIKSLFLKKSVGVINVCSSENPTYFEIVKKIIEQSEKQIKVNIIRGEYKGKDMIFDPQKRKQYLGDESFDLKKGIELCYKWIKETSL